VITIKRILLVEDKAILNELPPGIRRGKNSQQIGEVISAGRKEGQK
jgi:hypothetical protein